MSDFVSDFWGIWIAAITTIGFIGLFYLVWSQTKPPVYKRDPTENSNKEVATTGHCWDGDLEEYHNPLPRWWMFMFYIALVFGVVYFVLYPGLGIWKGVFGWSSIGQYQKERAQAEAKYQPLYDRYLKIGITQLAEDRQAHNMGKRLFMTYCMQCHGADARGAKGFPNLTDNKWHWGGSPEEIHATISNGRHGQMVAWGPTLGEDKVKDVANYVLSLSGRKHDVERAARGKEIFSTICIACHGAEGKGNKQLGAPDLTDNNWLYGGTEKAIMETITNGRDNQMPAWKNFLGEGKVHLLTAYVWGLSNHRTRPPAK